MKFFSKLFLVCVCLLALDACQKPIEIGEGTSGSFEFNIADIEAQYRSQLASLRLSSTNRLVEKTIHKNFRWEKLTAAKKGDDIQLIVPFEIKDEFFKKTDDGKTVSYSSLSRLVISKKSGKYEYEVVTKHVDPGSIDSEDPTLFRGIVTVEDIGGNFKKGYKYTKEGISSVTRDNPGARKSVQVCQYIDWYSCSIRNENGLPIYENCAPMYTQTVGCVEEQEVNNFVLWEGQWYFNFGGPGNNTPKEIRVVGDAAPLDKVCSASFNYSGNQNTSINYQTSLQNLRFENGSTVNNDPGSINFFIGNKISDYAMNQTAGPFSWMGIGSTPKEYVNKYFPYLLGSNDIVRVYDTQEGIYVWNFSPTAVKVISALAVNEAAKAVGNSSFGQAATPGNTEAFRNLADLTKEILNNFMPGARVKWTNFAQYSVSVAQYAPNCK